MILQHTQIAKGWGLGEGREMEGQHLVEEMGSVEEQTAHLRNRAEEQAA
jgi:hypothetical protein